MTEKGKKVLFAILGAVGGVVVLCIALIVGFGYWVTRPGELIDPSRLLGETATGYAEWTLSLDDPGTEGFVNLMVEGFQDLPGGASNALQPFLGGWMRNAQQARAQQQLQKAFPMLAAWTLHAGATPSDDDLHLLSVSARNMGNQLVLADWIAGLVLGRTPNTTVYGYHGEKIFEVDPPDDDFRATFFARRGAVFATSDVQTAQQAVDLLAETETPNRGPTALEDLFRTTTETDPLRAALTNGSGEIARLWERISDSEVENPEEWSKIHGVTVSGRLEADGAFVARMRVLPTDPASIETLTGVTEAAFRQELDGTPFEFEVQAIAAADAIELDIRIPNLVDSLETWMRESGARRRGPGINVEIE